MYIRVPAEAQTRVLKEIKRARLRTYIKYAPFVMVAFSTIAVLFVLVKGPMILNPIQRFLEQKGIASGGVFEWFLLGVVLLTCAFVIFLIRQDYAECRVEEYRYCQACDAVDNYDDGRCPICSLSLTETAQFIRVSPDDKKILSFLKLKPCKHALSPSPAASEIPIGRIEERCVPVCGVITEQSATECIAKLLFLEEIHPGQPIMVVVDSPGGAITPSLAIIDTIDNLNCPVWTFCDGHAGGTAAVIVAHGARGSRISAANSRFSFSPTFVDADGAHLETELSRINQVLVEHLAEDANKHEAEVRRWFVNSNEFTAQQAVALGLVDLVDEKAPRFKLHPPRSTR